MISLNRGGRQVCCQREAAASRAVMPQLFPGTVPIGRQRATMAPGDIEREGQE